MTPTPPPLFLFCHSPWANIGTEGRPQEETVDAINNDVAAVGAELAAPEVR